MFSNDGPVQAWWKKRNKEYYPESWLFFLPDLVVSHKVINLSEKWQVGIRALKSFYGNLQVDCYLDLAFIRLDADLIDCCMIWN